MQSTGQTSTHERSFTVMHGSAIMYGIQAPEVSHHGTRSTGPKCKHRGGPTPVTRTRQRSIAPGTEIRVISDSTATSQVYCSSDAASGSSAASPNQAAAAAATSSRDRKSTRLNSSHSQISYAVFCLKKKKKKKKQMQRDIYA